MANRYVAEEVIGVEVLVEVEVASAADEAEVERETVEIDEAGYGSVSIPIMYIMGETLTAEA